MRRPDRVKLLVLLLAVCGIAVHIGHVFRTSTPKAAPPVPPMPATASPPPLPLEVDSPPPPTPQTSPHVDAAASEDACGTREHTEYDGDVVMWGPHNVVDSAAKCCAACRAHGDKADGAANGGCNIWVWCSDPAGCAGQKFGECWGKKHTFDDGKGGVLPPKIRGAGNTVAWVSGALATPAQARAMREADRAEAELSSEIEAEIAAAEEAAARAQAAREEAERGEIEAAEAAARRAAALAARGLQPPPPRGGQRKVGSASAARLPQIYDASHNPYGAAAAKGKKAPASAPQGGKPRPKPGGAPGAYKERVREPMVF